MFMFHMRDVGAIPIFRTITIMKIKEKYKIKRISNNEGKEIILKNHYLHRTRPCSYAFGLFDEEDMIGVILYGMPASRPLCVGVCGKEESDNVMELARLWISDDSMKNAESFFIANTMKYIKEEIIISYSEPQYNHRGVVYQASNFIYCGLSEKRTDIQVKGLENKHNRHIGSMNDLIKRYGIDNVKRIERPRKHRYIYFNCSKGKRKYLLKKLNYEIKPYPKEETPKETPKDLCQICGAIYTGMTYEQHEARPFHQDRL